MWIRDRYKRRAVAEVLVDGGATIRAEDREDLALLLNDGTADNGTRAGTTGGSVSGVAGTLRPVPPRVPQSPGGGFARGSTRGTGRSVGTAPPPFTSSSLSSSGRSSPASVYSPNSSRPSSASDFEGHGGRRGGTALEPLDYDPSLPAGGPGGAGRDPAMHMAPRRAGDTKQSFLSRYGLANKAGLFRLDE